jgi:hypothetical protein
LGDKKGQQVSLGINKVFLSLKIENLKIFFFSGTIFASEDSSTLLPSSHLAGQKSKKSFFRNSISRIRLLAFLMQT